MKLSNVIAFTQCIQHLVAESHVFIECFFIPDDTAASLRVSVEYRESFSDDGVAMYGQIFEDIGYEEFNKTDFDPMTLSENVFSKLWTHFNNDE